MSARAAAPAAEPAPGPATLVWRSLPIQAAFNPETLQGAGFACALLPHLRRVHGPAAGERAAALASAFNANPYLATYALGAIVRAEGREPPERIERFLHLVRGPLGALGDALFWGTARPALFVPAALAVVAGAPWWLAVVALVAFNALAFAARVTGACTGLASGLDVAARLGSSWIRRSPAFLRGFGAVATGALAGVVLARAAFAAPTVPAVAIGPAAVLVFLAALVAFALFPRRLGWGPALLALWALLEGWQRVVATGTGAAA